MWRERVPATLRRDLRELLPGAGDGQLRPGGSRANRLRWWVCFSGALHLALIVTLLVVPTSTARRDLPVPVYSVDLVAGSMPAPRPEPPKAETPRFEALPLVEEEEDFFVEPPAREPPKAAVAPVKPPPPPKVKEEVKKAPKSKPAPAKTVKKAAKKPKKQVVKRKRPAKKQVVKRKKPPSSKVAKKKPRKERAPKAVAKVVKKTPKASKPKSTANSRLAERVRRRRIDDALATARERARLKREARAGQGSAAGTATARGGSGGGVVKGMEFLAYRTQMLTLIRDRWTWIGKRKDLEVTVGFGVGVDGEVFGLKLLKPSGDASFDESVVRAVRRASSSLGPPPPRHVRDFAEVEVTFRPHDLDG